MRGLSKLRTQGLTALASMEGLAILRATSVASQISAPAVPIYASMTSDSNGLVGEKRFDVDMFSFKSPSFRCFSAKTASKNQEAAMAAPHDTTAHEKATEEANDYMLFHPVYTKEYVESIKPFHVPPKKFHEYTGYYAVQSLRYLFDIATGYGSQMTETKWVRRFLFLETVAGVPGMVAAMLRHMRSLRTMKRDHGWMRTLLEEAENERMHLMTFMQLRQPGPIFRAAVLGAQGVFLSLYSLFYAISPRHCHSFVSYLEEEAVKTYTRAIDDLDSGRLPDWSGRPAPEIAINYWRLNENANMRDLLLAVRADEAMHRHVNAVFAGLKADDPNPFGAGESVVPDVHQAAN